MVAKLIFHQIKTFQFLKLELFFYLMGAIVEVVAIYFFLSFLMGDILKIQSYEVILVLGIQRLLVGVSRTFYLNQLLALPVNFRQGLLDRYFLAPINTKLYYCLDDFSVKDVLNIVVGTVLVIYGLPDINIYSIMKTCILLIMANIILFSGLLIISSLLASKVNPGPLNAIFVNIFSLAQFKPEHFPVPFGIVIKFIVPLGLLIWKPIGLITHSTIQDLSVFFAITLMLYFFQEKAWQWLMYRYNSAS
ncbi:ABC-2 family transporter protein [Gynuella sp.]|uniref:ABC-2 family transporter protein n=1 Tax=Gynuella sp. TaxID=2969146 RepID=UPI003D0DC21F